ncbi:unnamed protein product [Didymodactylos carnosus]|uniref:Uncharacterized protein n=1 Tax=Didymodactylos carnosus TaxID=1234261 RepID=A0A814CLU9_9BILA|nr:unnamed protein product [Didymodactylos carnosus]CAF3718532.1 unnamed protein product [Didymodactylos carnosus]
MELLQTHLIELYQEYRKNSSVTVKLINIKYKKCDVTFEKYLNDLNNNVYDDRENRQLLECFTIEYLDLFFNVECTQKIILNKLYDGLYSDFPSIIKTYLFEYLDSCKPKLFLNWILDIFNDDQVIVDVTLFNQYVQSKRKKNLTNGEIRYTIVNESRETVINLLKSKIFRDNSFSKTAWLALFRLKQNMLLTVEQKELFTEWLNDLTL